jgi:cyclic patellamide precursor peptide PatG
MERTKVRGASSDIDTGNGTASAVIAPQHGPESSGGSCPTCGSGQGVVSPPTYVYALGRIEPRFPRLSIEKEFAQATATKDAKGLTERQAMYAALSKPENRYLVRQLCWVLTIEGLETYMLAPRDPTDLQLLVDAVRPTPTPADLDAVIGLRGPLAAPEMCNGLMVPMVAFDQIYSFDRDTLLKAIPAPKKSAGEQFTAAAAELFDRIMLMADNAGATDDHRAVNYLAVRYPAIYHTAADMLGRNAALTALEVRPSSLSGTRRIVDVIFTYTYRETDVAEKHFCRVDVTEEFPFLVTKLSPYYDRL